MPLGWTKVRLADIAQYVTSGSRDWSEFYAEKGALFIRTQDINTNRLRLEDVARVNLPKHVEGKRSLVAKGDMLITITGANVGKCAVVREQIPEAYVSQSVALVKFNDPEVAEYARMAFLAPQERGKTLLESMAYGLGRPVLSLAQIRDIELALPPLNEQRRIVAKLEALQAPSRRAREALNTVPPLLEKLRQSILAAAFRGDLTKDWRAQNPNPEPASALLARIRTGRRQKWEESELAKLKAKDKPPTDDRWKANYKEPEPVDTTGLPDLPEGWCWASVEELASDEPRSIQSGPFGSNLLHSEFTRDGVLAIGIDNVRDGAFSMGSENRINEGKYKELQKYAARGGDVLVTVMATVGRCCTVPEDLETAIITKHVYRVSPERRLVLPDYLMHSMRGAPALRDAMKADLRGQTRPGINGEIIRALPVPVAPLGEQREVLAQLDAAVWTFAVLERLLASTGKGLDRLDGSMLAKAFRGELVSQDPNDEPADAMLARLNAKTNGDAEQVARAKQPKKLSGRKTRGARAEET